MGMLDLVSEPLEYPGGVQHGLPYGGRHLRGMRGGMGEDTDPEPSRITTDQSGQATRRKGGGSAPVSRRATAHRVEHRGGVAYRPGDHRGDTVSPSAGP